MRNSDYFNNTILLTQTTLLNVKYYINARNLLNNRVLTTSCFKSPYELCFFTPLVGCGSMVFCVSHHKGCETRVLLFNENDVCYPTDWTENKIFLTEPSEFIHDQNGLDTSTRRKIDFINGCSSGLNVVANYFRTFLSMIECNEVYLEKQDECITLSGGEVKTTYSVKG